MITKEERDEKYYLKQVGEWRCRKCDEIIMSKKKKIVVPVWDGPFPCTGMNNETESYIEEIPFCPNCEDSPDDK